VKQCDLPQGQNCFQAGQDIAFKGFVTNCGDITLTNVIVSDNRTGTLLGTNGLPLLQPLTLTSGQVIQYHGTFTPTLQEICAGGATNTVTVSGQDNTAIGGPNSFVTNSATVGCPICVNPCLAVTKSCTQVALGAQQTVSGVVTNCGNITLTNISITDNILGAITNIASLAPGGSSAYSKSFTSEVCGTNANFVTAAGFTTCGTPISAHATNACIVTCPPAICVIKEVACFLGSNVLSTLPSQTTDDEFCGIFSKFAVGVSGNTDPAFCYRITVTNCGNIPLTNVTVIDNQFGDFTSNFFPAGPTTVFQPGGTVTYIFKATVDHNLTNVVTVAGKSAADGSTATATDSAAVKILPASVSCDKQYSIDGGALTDNATLPDQAPHTIVWYVTVSNPSSQVNLEFVTLHDLSANLGCEVTLPPFSLPAGSNIVFAICTNTVACSNGFNGITNSVSVIASSFSVGTNHLGVCAHDIAGTNIEVDSECSAALFCSKPEACRVTGGGRQDSPPNFPANVRYITHGGQVGAPVGDHICVVTADFPIGNPCIHGRWTHVRHQQGGNEGNFHARFYDTLECACLDTNLTPVVVTIGQQTYTNLVYGPGTTVDTVCNPDDRASGPLPRPAPSNKIVFTGIGDYAETQGRRTPVSVLFRVDVEDRSEPGGSHPKGGTPPPDRNRTRIWILTQSELAQLHGAGPDPLLLNFRNAISACNGIDVQDGATVPNGTAAFGVRAPNIDDGGELTRGNYQIHPSIKDCDPFNPTGPGLANP